MDLFGTPHGGNMDGLKGSKTVQLSENIGKILYCGTYMLFYMRIFWQPILSDCQFLHVSTFDHFRVP